MKLEFRLAALMCVLSVVLAACKSTPKAEISKVLRDYGYATYSPFRTNDFPGTIFALADNHEGRLTELSLSNYTRTFKTPPSQLFPQDGQTVLAFTELNKQFTFDVNTDVKMLKWLVNVDVLAKWTKKLSIRFGVPQKTYTMELAALAGVQDQLQDNVKVALSDFKKRGQLDNVYIVTEVLQVPELLIELDVTSEAKAGLSAEKIKELLNFEGSVESKGEDHYQIKSRQPLLVGYKAITIPNSMLLPQVSTGPVSGYLHLDPGVVQRLKARAAN